MGGVLRRRPRQRVCARRADRPAALEDARGRSRRRAHYRRREVSRRAASTCRSPGSEEFNSGNKDYPCCTARGGVAALDANTGKEIWKSYLADPPKPWKKPANGAQLYGPATGGVWNAPTIDPVRGALYVGTGDAVTPPESPLTDAVIALDLKTGKLLWSHRATENDLFMGGCAGANRSEACPSQDGSRLRHRQLADPRDAAERQARVVCRHQRRGRPRTRPRRQRQGVVPRESFRTAGRLQRPRARRDRLGWRDAISGRCTTGWAPRALARFNRSDGKTAWVFTATGAGGRGVAALGAAPTAIPGVVFQGSGDGRLFAVSATDGKQLWEFNTAQDIATVNKVPARGGAIATAGAVSWTEWSTSRPATRSAAARRRATSCWLSAWSNVRRGRR